MKQVGIVGTGRLARAIALALAEAPGFALYGIWGRRPQAAAALAVACENGKAVAPRELGACDLVVLAVADDALFAVAAELASEVPAQRPQLWLHGAGAWGLEPFVPLAAEGRRFATLHPLASLSATSAQPLRAQTMVLSGEESARDDTVAFATALCGRPVWIPGLDRAAYHAAASLLANGLTSLFAAGLALLEAASGGALGTAEAHALATSALSPLASLPPEDALTGPVRRGDAEVVARHRAALRARRPDLLGLYDALMREALDLAVRAGLPADGADRLRRELTVEEAM